jgi:catechol 2,3-dioxygenase-like lactoylglutathione lyase family enzyme
MPLRRVLVACLLAVLPALAQPSGPPPVTAGHIHLNSADPDAAIAFWKDVLGAPTVSVDSEKGIGMSGVTILFTRKTPSGPSAGSAIDHLALKVADLQPFTDRLAKTTYKSFSPKVGEELLMIEGPDGVRIELIGDSAMYTSVEFNSTHLHSAQPKEMQAWYAKTLSGRVGRAIDHLSFEVRDLESFCKKLSQNGVKIDSPPHAEPRINGSVALLTDPWGTRIELTEHSAK